MNFVLYPPVTPNPLGEGFCTLKQKTDVIAGIAGYDNHIGIKHLAFRFNTD
jgi:hypothetical protein